MQHTATGLSDGSDYVFQVTATDRAGNTAVQAITTQVDRVAPISSLTAPIGTIGKTWAVLRWTSSDNRAGIASYALDVQANGGAWQPWRMVSGGMLTIFEGTPNTTYRWRIRATDQAGNAEAIHASADIAFTTGTDSRGLTKIRLPVVGN